MSAEDVLNSPVAIASIGNVASQFYANFTQQYVPYCIMVNGSIIEENKATGAASMRQAAITNYQGNVRFPDIDMVYNNDGSVNTENVIKQIERLEEVRKILFKDSGRYFWNTIESLKKEYDGESYFTMFAAFPENLRNEVTKPLMNILKSCGIVVTEYDLFLASVAPVKNKQGDLTISQLAFELEPALKAIQGLPDDEHMFESSYKVRSATDRSNNYETGITSFVSLEIWYLLENMRVVSVLLVNPDTRILPHHL